MYSGHLFVLLFLLRGLGLLRNSEKRPYNEACISWRKCICAFCLSM